VSQWPIPFRHTVDSSVYVLVYITVY
jgi:hypothetical protein